MNESPPDLPQGAPLGAQWDGRRTRVRVWSPDATALQVVVRRPEGAEERHDASPLGDGTWTAALDAPPGTPYGLRVHGPFEPRRRQLFNPAKLLLDPYARAIAMPHRWDDRFRTVTADPAGRLLPDPRDSAPAAPWGLVVDPAFDWQGDAPPGTPWSETVIYECHVRGMTAQHPDVPRALRGTYLGLASEPVLEHLRALGVTAVQLLPIHHSIDDARLHGLGLTNYWGYASVGFFAPDARWAWRPGAQVAEFREMVRRLHAAGLEVLLDVVYNHTGEGPLHGPTVAFRGLDNAGYYRPAIDDPLRYDDVTGCGNTLDVRQPVVRQLILDSLRYWAAEMHVDGFRFDLAPALGRDPERFSATAPLLQAIHDDPLLRRCKLIAEPWDLGPDGYQLGRFPRGWAEWNGRYRDAVRRFWRGAGGIGEFAARLSGSSDLFEPTGRTPQAGVNFVACHDGFTLADVTMYERKHNLANGEANRDGHDWNESRNWGMEGPTDDARTTRRRARVRRSLLATVALSLGVPMLRHGDELLQSLGGNNNAYCHDAPLTWLDWSGGADREAWLGFVRRVFALRREAGFLRRARFAPGRDGPLAPLQWFTLAGEPLSPAQWEDPVRHTLAALLRVGALGEDDESRPRAGERWWLLALNGGGRTQDVIPPPVRGTGPWRVRLDTADPARADDAMAPLRAAPHALLLLEAVVVG